MLLTRRTLTGLGLAVCGQALLPTAGYANAAIHVHKGRGCGCCTLWANILKKEGFAVTEDEVHPAELVKLKISKGIPQKLFSCHTAVVDGYIVEGHVPVADIRRLLAEKPDALGIAVPEMPYGSPGMGPESEREAYDVFLFAKGREPEVFSRYEAAS